MGGGRLFSRKPETNYDNEFKIESSSWQQLPRRQYLKQLFQIPGAKMEGRQSGQSGKRLQAEHSSGQWENGLLNREDP